MCSHFLQRMDQSTYQGDLADIVRAGGGAISFKGSNSGEASFACDWRFASGPTNYVAGMEEAVDDFGDPFSVMQDPFLCDLGVSSSDLFRGANNSTDTIKISVDDGIGFSGSGTVFSQSAVDEGHQLKRPSNLFSKMFQISPNTNKLPVSPMPCDSPIVVSTSPRLHKPQAVAASDRMIGVGSEACLVESSTAGTVQISSPRHTSLKRRKCQAKKVVCIPAPAPVNSRSSGEVVPSDLWAWRKYGQKPIKGSPYPRGYYRCSSSKGCPARKQVERSRTDPNMLVITYTSEHNHPWPTQRNALAGSTRAQPPKSTSTAASKNISPDLQAPKTTSMDEEELPKESNISSTDHNVSSSIITTENSSTGPSLKEEEEMEDMDKQMEMDGSEFRPTLPDSKQQSSHHHHHHEDFFADLGEIDADPLNLLFTQGFTVDEERENSSKALDPFSLFDWIGNSNNNSPSFGDTKRGIL